jgi:hypothetical protein
MNKLQGHDEQLTLLFFHPLVGVHSAYIVPLA